MRTYLICQVGPKAGTRVMLAEETFLIGRDTACHLRSKSGEVSSRHCAIISRNGCVVVKNLNDRTGTYVNDRVVRGECRVNTGDKLRVGPLVFVVQMVPDTDTRRVPLTLPALTASHKLDRKPVPAEANDIGSSTKRSDPIVSVPDMSRVTPPDDADVLLADVPGRPGGTTLREFQETVQQPTGDNAAEGDVSLFPSPTVVYASPLPIDEGKLKVRSA